MPSPTSRTLDECRALGLTAQVVEKWNAYARVRVDLFDAIDVVACGEGYILGIQACAGGSHSKRLAKAVASPRIAAWIAGGGIFEVWSWSKRGGRGKRKVWTCRKERVTPPREIQTTHSAACACGCQTKRAPALCVECGDTGAIEVDGVDRMCPACRGAKVRGEHEGRRT